MAKRGSGSGRGEQAFRRACRCRLAGAGLDVYSPDAPQGPLAQYENVIFTPHLGATTEDALSRVACAAAGHVITALQGGMPATTLNPDIRKATA